LRALKAEAFSQTLFGEIDMAILDVDLTKTEETLLKKISVTKLGNVSKEKKGELVGWEYAPPQRGQPFKFFIYEGVVLKTSPVQDVKETNGGLIVKTYNSAYQVKYLKDNPEG
jgi:hypothetical protein